MLDLSTMFSHYGYSNPNSFSDGRLWLASDGQGGTQIWWDMDGLPVGTGGTWLITTLDHVDPSSLSISNGVITEGWSSSSGGSSSGGSASGGSTSGDGGQTFTSDNKGDGWVGTPGNDTFNLGRGGDWVTGNGGNDTFKFAQIPWAPGGITDFHSGDVIDLSGMFASVSYSSNDPVADGHIWLGSDGADGTQIWFNANGLPGPSGQWELLDLSHVNPSSLWVSGAFIGENG
jgi:hypothetical protein